MSADRDAPGARPALRAVAAAVLYLGLAVWSLRVLLPSPSTTTTLPASWEANPVGDADQAIMIWTTTRNARTLLTQPWRLQEFEDCFPTPHASGFGAPYYSDGVLAIPAYLLRLPPVLAFNSVALLALWISALGMFLLVHHWTRDFAAALVAGIAFGFHPARILMANWPHIVGNEWTPFVLLFTHRLFHRERWRDAVALTVFLGLQIVGCFYQFLPLVVIGATYLVALAVHHRRRLLAISPKLLPVVVVSVALGAAQFGPALHVQRTWGIMSGRLNIPESIGAFLPGGNSNPGVVVLLLGAVALVDRIRSRRTVAPDDPRLPLLVAGFLVVWLVVFVVPIPGTSTVVPNLLALVGHAIPGLRSALEAVRSIQFGRMGVFVSSALLAGFGVAALRRGRGRAPSRAVAVALVGMILAEVYTPGLAERSFGSSVELKAHDCSVSPAVVAVARHSLTGPVLDLPTGQPDYIWGLVPKAHAVLLAAFHERPFAACYNSFNSPLWPEVIGLADRLPEIAAADDLYALGFEDLVVHGDLLGNWAPGFIARLRGLESVSRIYLIDTVDGHWFLRLRSPVGVVADFAALRPPDERSGMQTVVAPSADVAFPFRNGRSQTYRHPDPIEPREVVVRWYGAPSGRVASEQRLLALLPVALAVGEERRRPLTLATPEPGTYRVTVARAEEPDAVLAVAHVRVDAAP